MRHLAVHFVKQALELWPVNMVTNREQAGFGFEGTQAFNFGGCHI
jgi:hypothetical protein